MFPSAAATVIVCSVASNSFGLCLLVPELEFKMCPPPWGGLERFSSFLEVLRESMLSSFSNLESDALAYGPFSMFKARNHRVSASYIRHSESDSSISLPTSEVLCDYL